jgi:hypothetical protein
MNINNKGKYGHRKEILQFKCVDKKIKTIRRNVQVIAGTHTIRLAQTNSFILAKIFSRNRG